jgi:16S rRNA (cytidine1402-2'-O)-methyltransferase
LKQLRQLCTPGLPVILFEAPTRIERLLADVAIELPNAHVTVGREITKLYEEWLRGTPEEIARQINPRGEFVVVIEPRLIQTDPRDLLDDTLSEALTEGATLREAVDRAIAATGMSRKPVYARALEISKRG